MIPPADMPRRSRKRSGVMAILALAMGAGLFLGIILIVVGAATGVGALTTIGAVFLLIGLGSLAYLTTQGGKLREKQLPYVVRELGLSFHPGDPFGLARAELPFERFRQRGVEVRNTMWGTIDGVEVKGFDARYHVHDRESGWQPTGWRFQALAEIEASCPPLEMVRGGGLAASDEMPRVGFESERFNREVTVLCPDAYFATALVDERLMAWILDTAPNWVHVELRDRYVLVWKDTDAEDVAATAIVLRGASELARRVPHVVSSLYPRPGGPPSR